MQAVCNSTVIAPQTVNCLLPHAQSSYCRPSVWLGCYLHLGDQTHQGCVQHTVWPEGNRVAESQLWSSAPPDATEGGVPASFPGVFDMNHEADSQRLRLCCTDGTLRWLSTAGLDPDSGRELRKNDEMVVTVSSEGTMLTSSTRCAGEDGLVCALHGGGLASLRRAATGEWIVEGQWEGHEFDSWCVAAATEAAATPSSSSSPSCSSSIVYSGGDDGLLRMWDLRQEPRSAARQRRFEAGVVTIVPESLSDDTRYLYVGSYDESLYLMDERMWKQPLASCHVGGGVWRLRPLCDSAGLWVCAAMQRGAAALRLSPREAEMEVLSYFHEEDDHEEKTSAEVLIYDVAVCGSSQQPKGESDTYQTSQWKVATASFYNRAVKLWDLTPLSS